MVTVRRALRRLARVLLRRRPAEPQTLTRLVLPGGATGASSRRPAPPLPPLPGEYAPGAPDAAELAVRRALRDRTTPR